MDAAQRRAAQDLQGDLYEGARVGMREDERGKGVVQEGLEVPRVRRCSILSSVGCEEIWLEILCESVLGGRMDEIEHTASA